MLNKQKRVVVYISEQDYKKLKLILAGEGKTVSGWFRSLVTKLLSR